MVGTSLDAAKELEKLGVDAEVSLKKLGCCSKTRMLIYYIVRQECVFSFHLTYYLHFKAKL